MSVGGLFIIIPAVGVPIGAVIDGVFRLWKYDKNEPEKQKRHRMIGAAEIFLGSLILIAEICVFIYLCMALAAMT